MRPWGNSGPFVLRQPLRLDAGDLDLLADLRRAANVEPHRRGGFAIAVIDRQEVVVPPLHTCVGQRTHHAGMDEREVGSFERAPAALLHGCRGATGHHVQTLGVVCVQEIVVGEFAGDEGYGEGDCFAIRGPTAIAVELAGLGRVSLVMYRAVAAQE